MFLYTVIPVEDVLEGFDDDNRQVKQIQRGSLTMEVEPLEGSLARLLRVVSSDPADYLDERWQPGTILQLEYGDLTE